MKKIGIPGGTMGPLARVINTLKEINMSPACFIDCYQDVMSRHTFALVLKGVRQLENDEARAMLATLEELKDLADSFPYGLKPDWSQDVRDIRAALRTRRNQDRELKDALAVSQRER